MPTFRDLIAGDELIVAPVALNPLMARLAAESGFKALYMSGGSLGWLKCVTEANLALPEMIEVALDMRAVCPLPISMSAAASAIPSTCTARSRCQKPPASPQSNSKTSCCRAVSSIMPASIIWCRPN